MTAVGTPSPTDRFSAITSRAARNRRAHFASRADILATPPADPELQNAVAGLAAAITTRRYPAAAYLNLIEDYDRLCFGDVLDADLQVLHPAGDVAWQDESLPELRGETLLDLAQDLDVTGSAWGRGGIATFEHGWDGDGPRARINIAAAMDAALPA